MVSSAEAFLSPLSLRPACINMRPARSSCGRGPSFQGIRMSSSPTASKPGQDEYSEGIEKVRKSNPEILPHFSHIRQQRFFRYYAVDLLSSCSYFPTIEFPCEMAKCDVDTAEDVPEDMRERDQNEHFFALDGWVRWDMPGERSIARAVSLVGDDCTLGRYSRLSIRDCRFLKYVCCEQATSRSITI
jgi:hypothetical protein